MKLLDTNSNMIGKTFPLVLELDDKIAINGQLYDKTSLKPYPFSFYFSGDNDQDINMYNVINNVGNYNPTTGGYGSFFSNTLTSTFRENYMIDNKDSNILYVQSSYQNTLDVQGNQDTIIYKLQKDGNYYKEVAAYNKNYYIQNILFQNDNYIYGHYNYCHPSIGSSWSNSTSYSYGGLFKINKSTFAVDMGFCGNISLFGQRINNVEFLYQDDYNNAYVMVYTINDPNGSAYVSCNIVKLDCTTEKGIILTTAFSNVTNFTVISNCVKIGNSFYMVTDKQDNGHKLTLLKITIDELNNVAVTSFIDINNASTYTTLNSNPKWYTNFYIQTIDVNGKIYLYIVAGGTGSSSSRIYTDHEIIVMDFDNDVVTFKGITPIGDECKGVLTYQNNNNLLVLTQQGISFYTFDSIKGKFLLSNFLPGIFKSVGIDSLGRIWTYNSLLQVEILSCPSPVLLQADFQDELYDFDGTDIETNVICYAKNYIDSYTSAKVTLTLYGDVYFKSNNGKSLTLTTSTMESTIVPVVIKGYGNIEVLISEAL